MCYVYATPTQEELEQHLGAGEYEMNNYQHYYVANGFDPKYMPVTIDKEPRIVGNAIWGLVPHWVDTSAQAKEIVKSTLNARNDKIFERPSYKNYIGSQRCLVWASGFYEHRWNDPDKKTSKKTPYFIYRKDKQPLSFGGVYSFWERPDNGQILKTFSIITTEANELMADIHNSKKRMPFIVDEALRATWLGDLSKEEIATMMQPYTEGLLTAHTISKDITSRGVDPNVASIQDEVIY